MKISVMFSIRLEVNIPRENYSGSLVLWNSSGPMTFYFLFLHPYSGDQGELGIFEDENLSIFYGAALAQGVEYDPVLDRKLIHLDFDDVSSATKLAMCYLIASIVAETISDSEDDMADLKSSGVDFEDKVPMLQYENRIWSGDFSETPELAESLRQALRLS